MKQIIFFILLLTVVSYSQPIDTTTTGSGGLSKSEIESIIGDSTYALRLALATQASVALKAPIASPTFTGTVTFPSPFTIGTTSVTTTGAQLNYLNSTTSNVQTQLNAKEGTITAGTALQYFRGDKTWATLNSTAVGLGNVTNESKTTMFTSPTFTSSVTLPATITIGSTALLPDITELNYLDNATSNIQTQLNAKVNTFETSAWDKNASDDVTQTDLDKVKYFSFVNTDPDSLTSFTLIRVKSAITIDSVFTLMRGADTSTVSFNIEYSDKITSSNALWATDQTVVYDIYGNTITSFFNTAIAKNNMIWLSINAIENTPTEFLCVIYYH